MSRYPLHFLGKLEKKCSDLAKLWPLDRDAIPARPGVYILVAKKGFAFQYPKGKSPIYYIGQAKSLRRRLSQHHKWHTRARKNQRGFPLLEPRHEYGAAFGGRYCFIKTWQGHRPKNLEEIVLAEFALKYRAFPVANSAGAWTRIETKRALKTAIVERGAK